MSIASYIHTTAISSGNLIHSAVTSSGNMQIDMSSFSSGLYLVRFLGSTETIIRKIIKN
ncbi:MAG: T9SS type A sorting domain-containing protein [Bacteroidia bacterium]